MLLIEHLTNPPARYEHQTYSCEIESHTESMRREQRQKRAFADCSRPTAKDRSFAMLLDRRNSSPQGLELAHRDHDDFDSRLRFESPSFPERQAPRPMDSPLPCAWFTPEIHSHDPQTDPVVVGSNLRDLISGISHVIRSGAFEHHPGGDVTFRAQLNDDLLGGASIRVKREGHRGVLVEFCNSTGRGIDAPSLAELTRELEAHGLQARVIVHRAPHSKL